MRVSGLHSAALLAAAAVSCTAPNAGASPARALSIPGQVVQMQASADGGLSAVALTPTTEGLSVWEAAAGAPAIHRILPDGTVVRGTPAPGIEIGSNHVGLLGDQAMLVYDVPEPPSGTPFVAARTLDADGTLSPEEIVSTPGREASNPGPLAVGPTGAVAFTFWQDQGKRTLGRLAFRPAGAGRFLPPRTLGPAHTSDGERVFLGPDGGGIVVIGLDTGATRPVASPIRLRRLSPDGRLGPPLTLRLGGRHLECVATGAYAGTTFTLAVATDRVVRDGLQGALYATSLAASAARPTTPQRLTPAPASDENTIKIATNPAGRVTLLAPLGSKGMQFFAGIPGKLRRAGRITARSPLYPRVAVRPDGGASAFWLASVTSSTDVRLQTARGTPTGRFSPASLVPGFPANPLPGFFGSSEDSLTDPVVLADGHVAIAYNPQGQSGTSPDAAILTVP